MHSQNSFTLAKSLRAGCVALLLLTVGSVGPVFADAESDYQAGQKSFDQGDVVGSMAPLRLAADAGHAKAQVLLAQILDYSEFDEEALQYYRKAANQGNMDGMYGYGAMLLSGEGLKEKNVPEGRAWVLKAAELGHRQAINVIATALMTLGLGYQESDQNSPQALRWIQASAKNDYLPAVDALANAYREGGVLGAPQDPVLAEEYQAQANRLRGIDPSKVGKRKKTRR